MVIVLLASDGCPATWSHRSSKLAVGADDAAAARPVGAHQQTCARGRGLAEHLPDVTLTVTNRDHAGFATGRRQFPGTLEAFQPTATFLLVLLCVVTEVGIKREHAQRPANRVHRKSEVGHQALDTLAGTTEPDKPPGRLEAVIVDRGGVLDRENDLLQGTALDRRSLMALENVFHGHPVTGQQTVRRLALGLAREHNRQGCAQMLQPRTAHLHDPLPDTAVGMAAASILVIGPVRSLLEIHRTALQKS